MSDAQYYFGYGIGPDDEPSLEAVKTWLQDDIRHFDTFTVGEYGSFDEAAVMEAELEWVLEEQGLESAMQLAEVIASSGGYLDPERDDPRLFTHGPSDPFTTLRQEQLTEPRYSIGAISANGQHFLDVMKAWGDEDYERLVIPQPDWQQALDTAMDARQLLDDGELQSAMHRVELAGIRAGVIDPDRDDPRLFTQGPPDPFETLAQQLQGEINPYWNTSGTPVDDTEPPRWHMQTLPVNDPDDAGESHALHMVRQDDDALKRLEVMRFATEEQAQQFREEFMEYIIPGVLDGPELAEEVARLEGLPVEWQTLDEHEVTRDVDVSPDLEL